VTGEREKSQVFLLFDIGIGDVPDLGGLKTQGSNQFINGDVAEAGVVGSA